MPALSVERSPLNAMDMLPGTLSQFVRKNKHFIKAY